MKGFITHKTITVPAGKVKKHDVTGQFFLCKSASAEFQMSMNSGEQFPMNTGLGFELPEDAQFKELTFHNDTLSDITISYYAGRGKILLWK